jgi:cation diffusion facilitator CzcD-associated flavoprotein CzcO
VRARLAPVVEAVARMHLRRQVPDLELRARLTPDYAPGCKRILISDDYLPVLSRDNVEVVTDGIGEVREHSIVTRDGRERQVDTIIFGTGFHVTDVRIATRLRGGDGRSLAEVWAGGMAAHRGTTVAGFPNLFLLLGPNTGLGHTSVVLMAEAQAGYVIEALRHMRARSVGAIAVRPAAQALFNDRVQRSMAGTVWTAGGCASWYLDGNGRNTTLWPDFSFRFRRLLRRFDAGSYEQLPVPPAAEAAPAITEGAAA